MIWSDSGLGVVVNVIVMFIVVVIIIIIIIINFVGWGGLCVTPVLVRSLKLSTLVHSQ